MPSKLTPKSTPKSRTPKSTPKSRTPKSTPKSRTPKSTPKSKTPELTPKSRTPELTPKQKSILKSRTPESIPEEPCSPRSLSDHSFQSNSPGTSKGRNVLDDSSASTADQSQRLRISVLRRSLIMGSPKSPHTSPKSTKCSLGRKSLLTPKSILEVGSPRTPADDSNQWNSQETPKTQNVVDGGLDSTPYSLRKRIRHAVTKMVEMKDNSSDSDYNSSSDDDTEESEDEYTSDFETSDEDGSTNKLHGKNQSKMLSRNSAHENNKSLGKCVEGAHVVIKKIDFDPERYRSIRRRELKYTINPDDYFARARSKVVTSKKTLNKLHFDDSVFRDAISNVKISHKPEIDRLIEEHKSQFRKWVFFASQGYTVLLHGVGSKHQILNDFRKIIGQVPVITVNGFFPDLTLKEIVDIVKKTLVLKDGPANPHSYMRIIEEKFSSDPEAELFFLLHNIDGPPLRNEECQDWLSRLAAIRRVYFVATVDHKNATFMWNQSQVDRFNFFWYDCTTYLPYTVETSFGGSLAMRRMKLQAISSFRSVFKSLTLNSKKVFLLIAQGQLKNASNPTYFGITLGKLYRLCRDELIVSSEVALRELLREFFDHKLLKYRRAVDGSEVLHVLLDTETLKQVVEECSDI